MLYGYRIQRDRLRQVEGADYATDCDWIDLVAPDEKERTLGLTWAVLDFPKRIARWIAPV